MASSFKIKLKLPPNPNQGGTASSSSNQDSPQRSSVPAEGSSIIDGGSSVVSEDIGGEGEEMDELEDSPPPEQDTPGPSTPASPSGAKLKRSAGGGGGAASSSSGSGVKKATRPSIPMGLPKPIDQMTIEEIEALPAAKRRKSLKARGAAGPGRGWRKGLKMDQKPVYVQPGSGPAPTKVAPSTPTTFAGASSSASRPRSSLAREALSKTSTPMRSESPYSRGSPMGGAANDSTVGDSESKGSKKVVEEEKRQLPASAAVGGGGGGLGSKMHFRSVQPVLPLAKIPIGFATVTVLDKSGKRKAVRPWQKDGREIVSLTGKTWSALTWLTRQQSQSQIDKERESAAMMMMTTTKSGSNENTAPAGLLDADTPRSTPGPDSYVPQGRNKNNNHIFIEEAPSTAQPSRPASSLGQTNPGSSPEVDWRGNSAAFSAAVKRAA